MVYDEDLSSLRKLRLLADRYRIKQRHQNEPWPAAQVSTFQKVAQVNRQSFETYSESIDDQSGSASYSNVKKYNCDRAKWLVDQASRLSSNTTNESGWRMRIENTILERLSLQVAW